ncbi:hypothetical protein QUA04_07975 [Microcoleus sp. S13_C5]
MVKHATFDFTFYWMGEVSGRSGDWGILRSETVGKSEIGGEFDDILLSPSNSTAAFYSCAEIV